MCWRRSQGDAGVEDLDRKVLIIDDEPEIGQILKEFLGELKYRAFSAQTAKDGLEIFLKERPQVVFIDCILPRVNGFECLKAIKDIEPGARVVMMSGMNDRHLAKEAVGRGATAYILKPFELAYLKDELLPKLFSGLSDLPAGPEKSIEEGGQSGRDGRLTQEGDPESW